MLHITLSHPQGAAGWTAQNPRFAAVRGCTCANVVAKQLVKSAPLPRSNSTQKLHVKWACTATESSAEHSGSVLPDEQRFTFTIKKPLGLVLAEASDGSVFVESIDQGGNAAQHGGVQVGDIVRKTSARVLREGKSGEYARKGHGARPYEDWEAVMFSCDGEDFQTVLAAVRSNNERWGIKDVTLEVSRP